MVVYLTRPNDKYQSKQAPAPAGPQYTPASGYGTKSGNFYYAQTPSGGQWSTSPQTQNPVLGASTYNPASSGSGTGAQAPTFNPQQTIQDNSNDLQKQADYEFDQALSVIGQQEEAMRGQAGVDVAGQEQAGARAKTRAGEAQQSNLSALSTEQQSAEKQANTGLRGARDLFRETQQANIAQLSAAGLSSSSVNEALAERLGVETARRIGGITGSLEEVRTNISREKTRVTEVFQSKLTEIEEGTKLAIDQVRAGLSSALAQLGAARGQAATAKAQARTDIAVQARNQIQQIQMEAQQRAQSVSAAAQRREQALAEAEQFMLRPTDFGGIQQAVQNVQSLPQVGGFRAVPTFTPQTVQGQGFIQPGFQYEKDQEEQLANPFAT